MTVSACPTRSAGSWFSSTTTRFRLAFHPQVPPLSHLTYCQRCVDRSPPLADATQVRAIDTCRNLSRTSCSTQVGPCFVRSFVVFCSPLSSLPPCIAYLSCIKPPFAWPWPAPNHSLLFPPFCSRARHLKRYVRYDFLLRVLGHSGMATSSSPHRASSDPWDAALVLFIITSILPFLEPTRRLSIFVPACIAP